MIEIQTYRDVADLIWAGADEFIRQAKAAIRERGVFHVALSGGSTPQPMYAMLAMWEWSGHIDWTKVQVYWGDERCVPPDDRASNFRMANEALLIPAQVPSANIHRIRGEIEPAQAADEYAQIIADVRFDLVLLGMGDDGHTASLFPGTAAIAEQTRRVVAHFVPKLEAWRITLTPPAINAARNIVFLVSGENKAERLREVLHGPYQPDVLPAQIIKPTDGRLVWMVDQAAGARL